MPLDDLGRLRPPSNNEAETALLAAILSKNSTYDEIAGTLKPEHFAEDMHAAIFAAFERDQAAGKRVSAVTLANEFERKYLGALAASVVTLINNRHYAEVIIDCWRRRELGALAQEIDVSAAAGGKPLAETQEEIERRFGEIFADRGDDSLCALSTALDEAIASAERVYKADGRIIGIPTGLAALDSALGGLQKTDMIVVAGRPGMGKTALASRFTEGAAAAGHRVLFFSLEMSKSQLGARMLAGKSGVSSERQRQGPLTGDDILALTDARDILREWPYHIDDAPAASVAQLRGRARRMKRQRGLDLIVVDYVQLMVGGRSENRVQEISKITRDLKSLAKELEVPVVALSQLSRDVEKRDDKRPMLSDLRESGSIEQDADIVMFCYRDEYYEKQREPKQREDEDEARFNTRWENWSDRMRKVKGLADILIRKNRHGAERTVTLHFDGALTRFDDLQRDL